MCNLFRRSGKPANFAGITCEATHNSLEFRNLDGHGFLLLRTTQKVF